MSLGDWRKTLAYAAWRADRLGAPCPVLRIAKWLGVSTFTMRTDVRQVLIERVAEALVDDSLAELLVVADELLAQGGEGEAA